MYKINIIILVSTIISACLCAPVSFDPNVQLKLVNDIRSSKGASPLTISPCLQLSAQAQSEYQASISTMTHDSPLGGLFERMQAYGQSLTAAGENVAAGYSSDTSVVAGWKGSSGHLANMVNTKYSLIGMGMKVGKNGTPYWTQQFSSKGSCTPKGSSTTSGISTSSTSTTGTSTSSTSTSSTSTTSSPTSSPIPTPTPTQCIDYLQNYLLETNSQESISVAESVIPSDNTVVEPIAEEILSSPSSSDETSDSLKLNQKLSFIFVFVFISMILF